MESYPIPMVPGPVRVPRTVLDAYNVDYGFGAKEPEYYALYDETESRLQAILGTQNPVVIQTGEAMIALWGALKSCLLPGDRVLAIATGVFGYGIAQMARTVGAEVQTIGLEYDRTVTDFDAVEAAILEFKPKMITAVHCETPSGTLNPVDRIGALKQKHAVPLYYVDTVAGSGGVEVKADEWAIDLCLGGSQKCLSAPPGMGFLSVSPAAWDIIEAVDYAGYDALKPFHNFKSRRYPYTPYWHGLAVLNAGAKLLTDEGLENAFARHRAVADSCRKRLAELNLSTFPAPDAVQSPTVTAIRIPEPYTWETLDQTLRQSGMVVGSSHGPLEGKVFRLGHMGSQADPDLMAKAMDRLARALA